MAQSNFGSYYEQYLDNDSNSDLNYQKNLDALVNVCSDSGATLVVLEDDDWTPTDGIMSREETYNTVVLNRTNIGRQKLSTLSGNQILGHCLLHLQIAM